MESIRELYRIGHGPSSSHTMGPRLAAEQFKQRYPNAMRYHVTLFGSLAATGKGHLTDIALQAAFAPIPVHIVWKPDQQLPLHPNGLQFEAILSKDKVSDPWQVYSIGGGALREDTAIEPVSIYEHPSFTTILAHCDKTGQTLWEYVAEREGDGLWDFLREIWRVMQETIERGLNTEGVLPGAANNLLLQFQADLLQVPVVRPKVAETTAFGAACLAGLAVGFWKNRAEAEHAWQPDRTFEPTKSPDEVAHRRSRWAEALDRARAWEQRTQVEFQGLQG